MGQRWKVLVPVLSIIVVAVCSSGLPHHLPLLLDGVFLGSLLATSAPSPVFVMTPDLAQALEIQPAQLHETSVAITCICTFHGFFAHSVDLKELGQYSEVVHCLGVPCLEDGKDLLSLFVLTQVLVAGEETKIAPECHLVGSGLVQRLVEPQRVGIVTGSVECISNDPKQIHIIPHQGISAFVVGFKHLKMALEG
jgi:hypothetical protein